MLWSVSAVLFFDPDMPLGRFGHGFMADQCTDDPAMGETAAEKQNTYNDQNNSTCTHGKTLLGFVLCIGADNTQECADHKNVADCFREHQHAQDRKDSGCHSNGHIEKERQKNIDPHGAERISFRSLAVVQPADHSTQEHERNIADDAPGHVRAVLEPVVLREQTQDNPDKGQHQNGQGQTAVFLFLIVSPPDKV